MTVKITFHGKVIIIENHQPVKSINVFGVSYLQFFGMAHNT